MSRFERMLNEWSEKNPLKISDYSKWSKECVWWKCENGHEWKDSILHRMSGRNCPFCSHKRPLGSDLAGMSLEDMYPDIAKELDKEKNDFKASGVYPHSNIYAAWKCELGHTWTSKIASRTRTNRPNKCPYCSGRRVWPGFNDLSTTDSDALDEWDYATNTILPTEVSRKSHKIVYWICSKCGKSYTCSVANYMNGRRCPNCRTNHSSAFGIV